MTFENIRRILLPKEDSRKTTDIKTTVLVTNPDDARARRNRLAQLTNNPGPLKKAA